MSLIDLYISDCGSVRRIGDNCHDMLTIEDGKLCYLNLQNGEGCRLGEDGEWYRFVDNVDEYGYNCDPRKTENSSEIPNNSTISKMEQVDEPQTDCGDFADRLAYERGVKHAWEVAQKVFDSTVTFYEAEDVAKQIAKDEPQYDIDKGTIKCDNCSENGSYKCSKCDGEIYFKRLAVEDEPQTDCAWK